jgi:hypothetical protein
VVSPAAAIREGNFKLIEHWEDDRFELFDLAADLGEQNNLAPPMPSKVERMKKRFYDWQRSVQAQMTCRIPSTIRIEAIRFGLLGPC